MARAGCYLPIDLQRWFVLLPEAECKTIDLGKNKGLENDSEASGAVGVAAKAAVGDEGMLESSLSSGWGTLAVGILPRPPT